MDRKELLDYAMKGIGVEIAECESKIDKGYSVIDKINRNVASPTAKSKAEILETLEKYQQERAMLIQKRDALSFDYMMADTDKATEKREENVIKVALSSILSKDTESLGNLFIEEIIKVLDKIALRPYCERIGRRYDELTEEDKQIIADMQTEDYIRIQEQYNKEIEEGYNE